MAHATAARGGTPPVLPPLAEQRRLTDAMAAVAPGHGVLHDSYRATSPLPTLPHRRAAKRKARTPLNVPPASVWRHDPRT